MKQCIFCYQEIDSASRFCPQCGRDQDAETPHSYGIQEPSGDTSEVLKKYQVDPDEVDADLDDLNIEMPEELLYSEIDKEFENTDLPEQLRGVTPLTQEEAWKKIKEETIQSEEVRETGKNALAVVVIAAVAALIFGVVLFARGLLASFF